MVVPNAIIMKIIQKQYAMNVIINIILTKKVNANNAKEKILMVELAIFALKMEPNMISVNVKMVMSK